MQDILSKAVSRGYYRSSSFKMAALFTVLLGASALLLGYYLYDFGRENFIRETEAAIDNEIEHIVAITSSMNEAERLEYIRGKSAAGEHPVYLYQDRNETRLAGNIADIPAAINRIAEGMLSFSMPRQGEQRQMAAKIYTFADGSRLLIGRDIDAIVASHKQLTLISVLVMSFMLIVVLVSFVISVFVVGRINRIAMTAKTIMETGDLSRRISIESNWDDLSNLAQTLNALLARIEFLMHGIKEVGDNIAHDLRTPLTRLRTRLEEMQTRTPDGEDVAMLLGEADGLLATFNALLRIANIEKGKRHQAFAPVNVAEMLQDVMELYEPHAEEKGVRLHASLVAGLSVKGDRDLLFQAFANLMDNAIKFSPAGQSVQVTAVREAHKLKVTIADHGIGIAPAEQDKVFERFYRSQKSRHTAGSGLGLSLVKAVIELHNGDISLEANHPGVRVVVQL